MDRVFSYITALKLPADAVFCHYFPIQILLEGVFRVMVRVCHLQDGVSVLF